MKIKNFVEKSMVSSLYMVTASFQNSLEVELSELGINYVEALILSSLIFENEKENIGPTRLANVLGIKKARSSQALTRLQKMGYVRRELSMSDSRRFQIVLQPLGRKRAMIVVKMFNKMEENLEDILGSTKATSIQKELRKLALSLATSRK